MRAYLFTVLGGVLLGSSLSVAQVPDESSKPILITNVKHWNGSEVADIPVNILIVDGRISAVSSDLIAASNDALSVDAASQVVAGDLTLGKTANLVVVDGDPSEDITLLATPSSQLLVIKNGELVAGEIVAPAPANPKTTYRIIDPVRFKVVTVKKEPWYSYRNSYFSAAFGGAVLLDRTEFNTDSKIEGQVGDLGDRDSGEVRAVRAGVGGGFKIVDQQFAYAFVGANRAFDQGFDTDNDEEWTWYDWAIATKVYGGATLKVGKQKENISHDRKTIMVDQPFMERAMVLDGLLPSRNTGVTLANNALGGRMTWSVGAFRDMFGDRDKPFEDSKQYITRFTGLPYFTQDDEQLLHVGGGYRYSDTDSGVFRFKTGPEVYFSPEFVDTGEFDASNASWWAGEVGWKTGPWWVTGEYVRTDVNANQFEDPTFDGFHVTGTWAITGERRGYDRNTGTFTKFVPRSDVRSGGPGGWELAARYSEIDLDDGLIEGGDMSRISLGLNWWPTREFKGTVQYGWIDLDRFGVSSSTNVLQMRMAFLLGI